MAKSLSILVVEDEPLISMMLEDFLDSLGHRLAGTAETVPDALIEVDKGDFDIAILDVHLRGGEACWPIADALTQAGKNFVLATGGHVEPPPERHRQAPVLPKPYSIAGVREALNALSQESV
jgi:CheY-like chemotaxis protein